MERIKEIKELNEKMTQIFNAIIRYLEGVQAAIEHFSEQRDEEFFRGPEFNDLALVLDGKRGAPNKQKKRLEGVECLETSRLGPALGGVHNPEHATDSRNRAGGDAGG